MDKILTTFQISKLCRVDLSTVIGWVEQGKLKAYRTPGGHRRINEEDFLAFVKKYNLPVQVAIDVKSKPKILIVDDEVDIVDVIQRAISTIDSEIEVESAYDGFAAGKKVVDFLPDLIILDVMLPGVNGLDVARSIRSDPRLKKTKILIITGYATQKNINAISDCADSLLMKPFKIDDLVLSIKKLLKR